MINRETYHQVRRLNRELKLTPAQIAAKSVLNIKTIRKGLDKPRYEPLSKGSKLVLIRPPLAGFDSTADTRRLPRSAMHSFRQRGASRTRSLISKRTSSMVCRSAAWKHSMPRRADGWSRCLMSESIASPWPSWSNAARPWKNRLSHIRPHISGDQPQPPQRSQSWISRAET